MQGRAVSRPVPFKSSPMSPAKTNLKKTLRPGDLNAGHRPGKSSPNRLIIAIDFGTTYTGIAYAFTSDPSKIRAIQEWRGPDVEGRNDIAKVPSLIKYSDDEPVTFEWGYETNVTDYGVIRGIKLSLEPDKLDFHQRAASVDESDVVHNFETVITNERARLVKSTVDIVADYIGAVYEYAISKIQEKEFPGTVESVRKEFVVTVPAIWSDRAKKATLMAARKAHPDIQLNPDDLITEPEAAALFTFEAYSRRGLSQNDSFILCDAGGGTVDIISYKVTSLKPRMRMKEIVSPSGGAVGSMMLNNRFERYLRRILGEEQFQELLEGDAYAFHSIMNEFDKNVKPNFSSREAWDKVRMLHSLDFPVDVEDDHGHDIVGNTLTLSGEVVQEIFDPIVDSIIDLVREHTDKVQQETGAPAKAIFLVGGFGANKYLKSRLQACMGGIAVLQPEDAWAAVVKGAVLSKMPLLIDVEARKAQKNYGVMANVPYIHNEHPKEALEHAVYDPYEEINRVPKMTWYIYKDDDLCRDHKVRYPFHRCVPEDFKPEDLIFADELHESGADFPPKFPWQADVSSYCELQCDLSGLTKAELESGEMEDGTKYYIVEYDLVVQFGPALNAFSVERKGVSYGSVEAEY